MSTQLLHSVVLPMDGFLSLGWDRGRVCVAATVPGRPWTFYELGRDLSIIRSFQGGSNPSGPPQLFAPNDWRFCEMRDGLWEEWRLFFAEDGTPDVEATGRQLRGGNLQWRDGHVVSYVAAGHLEYDGQLVPFPEAQGSASIAGEWLLAHNHGNNRMYRMEADDIGAYETHDVPAFLFGQAQIAANGTVVYSEFPHGTVSLWKPSGEIVSGHMPAAPPQNPNWAWTNEGTAWICSGHDGQACAIGYYSEDGYLAVDGGSEPYARGCYIGVPNECAIARWDSIAKVIRVDTLTLDQPFTETDDPIDPPPIDPEEPDMGVTAAEVAAIVKASEKRVMNAVAIMLGQLVKLNDDGSVTPLGRSTSEQLDELNEATRAQRDGTVGSFFGTQPLTIKPNTVP